MAQVFAPDILKGKVAYVAGGTRGMNLAIAKRYAEYGASVAVMSRNPERCAKAQAEIEGLGVKSIGIPCDARDYEAVADSFAQTEAALGKIDPVTASVASQANVGGGTSALALARSLGRSDLVLPAILVGALGNAVGTYLGFLTAGYLGS